jgi:hypothetical protein
MALPLLPMLLLAGGAMMILSRKGDGDGGQMLLSAKPKWEPLKDTPEKFLLSHARALDENPYTGTMKLGVVPANFPEPWVPTQSTPQPGVYVRAMADNTQPLRVFANDNGIHYVNVTNPAWALVLRAYFGIKKDKANYDTTRMMALDPLIGSGVVIATIKKMLNRWGDALKAVGNFFSGHWSKMGNNLSDVLTTTPLIDAALQAKKEKLAAQYMVEAIAREYVQAVIDHPYNANLSWSTIGDHWGSSKVFDTAALTKIYIPVPPEN